MIDKESIRQVVKRQKEGLTLKQDTIERDLLQDILKWLKDNRVIILTGIRRSGKSTLLKQIMEKTEHYCYVNFEDERLIDFKAQDFELLNEVLIENYGNPKTYFFDEIQNIEKFEAFVRRLQDQGKKIIITGSNASLLSKELGTKLTGRYKAFEVYPFSFVEYLKLRGLALTKETPYIPEKKVEVISLFRSYLFEGGFPEYLKNKDKEYIQNIYDNILYRDIIARYSIKKQKIIKELVNILATNISSLFTYNSLKEAIGLSNSITVKEYISYLSNAYLFFELQRFDFSVRRQLNLSKKIYLVDPALHQIAGMNFSVNNGKVLENLAFIELKRRKKEAYYYLGKRECDFIIKEGIKICEAIQVCYVLNRENEERELSGLKEAMEKFKLNKGIILTLDQEEQRGNIYIIPVWKWLLGIDKPK